MGYKEHKPYIDANKTLIPQKYHTSGIYSITINSTIVYIGKSKDMQNRIANHMFWIQHNFGQGTEIKYKLLREYQQLGNSIQFNIVEYCSQQELSTKEAQYINQLKPCLNKQIPKIDNPRSYSINSNLVTSLEQLLYLTQEV